MDIYENITINFPDGYLESRNRQHDIAVFSGGGERNFKGLPLHRVEPLKCVYESIFAYKI